MILFLCFFKLITSICNFFNIAVAIVRFSLLKSACKYLTFLKKTKYWISPSVSFYEDFYCLKNAEIYHTKVNSKLSSTDARDFKFLQYVNMYFISMKKNGLIKWATHKVLIRLVNYKFV